MVCAWLGGEMPNLSLISLALPLRPYLLAIMAKTRTNLVLDMHTLNVDISIPLTLNSAHSRQ